MRKERGGEGVLRELLLRPPRLILFPPAPFPHPSPLPTAEKPAKKPKAEPKEPKEAGGAKEKKPRKKKDKNAPKKNLSAFMFFSNDMRAKVKEENPGGWRSGGRVWGRWNEGLACLEGRRGCEGRRGEVLFVC